MKRHQIESAVLSVFSTVLKQQFKSVDGLERRSTPGWDSLKHVEIVFAVEDSLAVQFTEEEMQSFDSAKRIVDVVESRHAS